MTNDGLHQKGFEEAIQLAIERVKVRRDHYETMIHQRVGRCWMGPYAQSYQQRHRLLIDECEAIIIELALLLKRDNKDGQ